MRYQSKSIQLLIMKLYINLSRQDHSTTIGPSKLHTCGSLSNFPASWISSHPSDLIWSSVSSASPSFAEGEDASFSRGRTELLMSNRMCPYSSFTVGSELANAVCDGFANSRPAPLPPVSQDHQPSWAPESRSKTLTPQNCILVRPSSLGLAGRRPALA